VTVHDLAFREVPEAFTDRGRRWHEVVLARLARSAVAFVVPSAAVEAALLDSGSGVSGDRVTVIEEGADHLPPPDDHAAETLLSALGIEGEFLLSVGTLEPRKNLARLFAAYRAVRPELPSPWPLLVCGPDGWLRADTTAPEGVVFAGRVHADVLSALYRRCRVFAYVPLLEGFGLPVVEAMHAGAVVVASSVPASAGAAFEVDPNDVDAIAEGLLRCAVDDQERSRVRERGAERVRHLTWRATALAHIRLWSEISDRARR
jgi:glycosyltransferase involved in cell wall biosynthesis